MTLTRPPPQAVPSHSHTQATKQRTVEDLPSPPVPLRSQLTALLATDWPAVSLEKRTQPVSSSSTKSTTQSPKASRSSIPHGGYSTTIQLPSPVNQSAHVGIIEYSTPTSISQPYLQIKYSNPETKLSPAAAKVCFQRMCNEQTMECFPLSHENLIPAKCPESTP